MNCTFFLPLAELTSLLSKLRDWDQRPVRPETGSKSSIEPTEKRKQESLGCGQSGLDARVS